MKHKENTAIIIGCARSGLAAAHLAQKDGYHVSVYDQKKYEQFHKDDQERIKNLYEQGVQFIFEPSINLDQYDLIIVSPGVPLDLPFIKEAVNQGKKVMGELEYASTFCKAPIVAITGTNGKTTTTSLVGQIIKAYNPNTYVVGNIGRAFSEDVLHIPEDGIVVAEVSSFQLETIQTFHPVVAAILNITPDHLNRHKTMENYCRAKYQVFGNQTCSDYLILNEQDEYFKEAQSLATSQVITFNRQASTLRGAFSDDLNLYENIEGTLECLCGIQDLKIVGAHNIENALAAIAICKAVGVPNEVIKQELLNFSGVEHRLEFVCTKKGVDYFNDSKATNVGAAIPGLISMHKPIHLIGGGMDKKISFTDWVELFEGRVKKLYLIGECKDQILQECQRQHFNEVALFETFESAIQAAYEEAQPNECVLLSPACASWDMFESYEQRGQIFKEIVNHLEG